MCRDKKHDHKLRMEQAKSNEEFRTRLIIAPWQESSEQDAFLRVEALIQFNPSLNNRQVIHQAITTLTMAAKY